MCNDVGVCFKYLCSSTCVFLVGRGDVKYAMPFVPGYVRKDYLLVFG